MTKLFLNTKRQSTVSTLVSKVFSTVFAFLTVLLPFSAHAQSLGDMMCSASVNLAPFESLFVGIAYIGGSLMIGTGLFQLAFYTDVMNQGRQYGISRPKGYLVAGAAMLALPAFIRFLVDSLFGGSLNADFGGGLAACVPYIGYGGTGGNVGLDGLMLNLVMNIKSPMVFMLSVISILLGIFLIMRALIKGSKFGQDAKATVANIMTNLTVGTILYTVGTSLNTIMTSLFGDAGIDGPGAVMAAIAADFGGNTQPFQNGVYAALTFFQLVGMIAFIRGWLILKAAVEGQGQKTVPQGLTHIIGGVLAVNIYRFLEVMDTSFGTGFL